VSNNDGRTKAALRLFNEVEGQIFKLLRQGGGAALVAVTVVKLRGKLRSAKLYLAVSDGEPEDDDEVLRNWEPVDGYRDEGEEIGGVQ
jgi:hypothetical protein